MDLAAVSIYCRFGDGDRVVASVDFSFRPRPRHVQFTKSELAGKGDRMANAWAYNPARLLSAGTASLKEGGET